MVSLQDFINLIAQLRHPQTGCPWDIKQDFHSMLPNLLEESYEVAEAIHTDDRSALREELGDLLLQVAFLSRLAEEDNSFTFQDVLNDIYHKLIRRHPHVFGSKHAENSEQALQHWEEMKAQEARKQQESILDDLPFALPALTRAQKLQKRCAKVGFDWNELPPVLEKVEEELDEVKQELSATAKSAEKLEEELGDLLFSVVNLCRHCDFDSEATLRKANVKFEQRFRKVEKHFKSQGKTLKDCSLEEMDSAWGSIKSMV